MFVSDQYFKDQWRNFCYTTGIRGFLFLAKSDSVQERFLWAVALFTCFAVTISDVANTVMLYMENPTGVNLKVFSNHEYNMSNMTLCYAINPNLFHDINKFQNKFDSANIDDEYFDNLIQIYKNRSSDLLRMSDYQNIYSAITYISNLYQIELVDMRTNSSLKSYGSKLYNSSKVAKKLGAIVWCILDLKVYKFDSPFESTSHDHCLESQITWLGYSPFYNHTESCITLSKESLSFTTFNWNLEIRLRISDLLPPKFPQLAVHLTPDPVMSYELPDVLLVDFGFNHAINIKLIGEYRSLATKEKICMTGDSIIHCYLNCRVQYFQERCSCKPVFSTFTTNYNFDLDKLCDIISWNEIAECFNQTDRAIAYNKCIKQNCPRPCKVQLNSIIVSKRDNHGKTNKTNIQIAARVLAYPIFQETYAFSARQFLAQLGGNLSLWLGASFLVLLHIVVSAAKVICNRPPIVKTGAGTGNSE